MSSQLDTLVGVALSDVRLDDATGEWVFRFANCSVLQAATTWRLLDGATVLLARTDHRQRFGNSGQVDASSELMQLLTDTTVSGVTLAPVGDLLLAFTNDKSLEVLNDSSGYEAWVLNLALLTFPWAGATA